MDPTPIHVRVETMSGNKLVLSEDSVVLVLDYPRTSYMTLLNDFFDMHIYIYSHSYIYIHILGITKVLRTGCLSHKHLFLLLC